MRTGFGMYAALAASGAAFAAALDSLVVLAITTGITLYLMAMDN
jgi:hypothetical protein